ncbi:hypothetical protein F511_20287 [Dorcoceras hygrometricum]|uniref:SAM domain-containing protein n=1 Tax=Dorcoceras hygrometricum TaxID=472368 RepID=A0A2Z7BVS3_9LAMI|nr:hypothetical protein F511_20287 [Dorcoceras hygrometricum]
MANPHYTIALGRSGQTVAKEATGVSDGGTLSSWVRLGNKRSLTESFGTCTDDSYSSHNERTRGDTIGRSDIYSTNIDDSILDPEDLRLKLTCKRISRRIEREIEERRKEELHENVSRAVRASESPERSLLTRIPSVSGATEPFMMDSYISQVTNGARPTSAGRVAKYSSGFSVPRTAVEHLTHVPSTGHMDASRTSQFLISDPLACSDEGCFLTRIPLSRGGAEPPQMDPVGSYFSLSTSGERPQSYSSDILADYFNGFSAPITTVDRFPHMPSSFRLTDASRTAQFLLSDPLESSMPKFSLPTMSMVESPMPKFSLPTMSMVHVDSGNLVKELPPVTGSMFMTPFMDVLPPTVSNLLHSLGLGKYAINFIAEEIDMAALKQMGELDLKELGIPMGPRKKILSALHPPRTMRPIE